MDRFNKRRDDFESDRQYDDYLELVEDLSKLFFPLSPAKHMNAYTTLSSIQSSQRHFHP